VILHHFTFRPPPAAVLSSIFHKPGAPAPAPFAGGDGRRVPSHGKTLNRRIRLLSNFQAYSLFMPAGLKVEPDSVSGTKECQMSLTPWELTTKRLTMARDEHNKAAEHHENAAKAHRSAAEHHGKGDHAKGKEHANVAKQHSQAAHQHTDQAHSKSQQQK